MTNDRQNRFFGEMVSGYNEPVLNEREIRASAGILFLFIIISFMFAILKMNFIPLKYFIILFLIDFLIRIFINPKYSPTLIIGRLIVSKQSPEYVSAAPKRFAWIIGLSLAIVMFIHMVIMNSYSAITGLICLICLIFLFFESSFGICLGCLFYPMFFKNKEQHCPGDICVVKEKHDIQKVSLRQILVVLTVCILLIFICLVFSDFISIQPHELFNAANK